VFLGEIFNAAIGFLATVYVIRKLSIEDYGLFSLFSSTMLMISGFGHLGWLETFVRFGSRHREEPIFSALLKFFFIRIMLCVLVIGGLVYLASGPITAHLYRRPDFAPYFHWAVIGAILLSTNGFFIALLRIRQNFSRYFCFQTAATALRFSGLLFLVFSHKLSLENIVYVYIVVPLFLALVHLIQFPKKPNEAGIQDKVPAEVLGEIQLYNRWFLLSIFTTTLIGNIDSQFLAFYFSDNRQMAYLGVASRMTLPLNFAISALATIILPKLSASRDSANVKIYFGKLKKFLFPVALIILAMAVAVVPILKALAGANYGEITTLLYLQIVSLFIVLLVNPVSVILFAWGKTKLLAIMNCLQLVLDIVLNILLIPSLGAAGATLSTIGVNLLGLVLVYYWVYKGLQDRGGAA
ncbi:MAG: oligosaccharide flippase family protein, partial [Bdellovibrionota bacterium]